MALKRNVKDQSEDSFWKPMFSKELLFRLKNIVEQTGLSPSNLAHKWILQEETLIGLMQRSKEPMTEQAETRPDTDPQKNTAAQKKRADTILPDPGKPSYRKTLIKKAQKLKKGGMTLKKIAETFNEEKVLTVSGTGKWYSSSIAILLNSKK